MRLSMLLPTDNVDSAKALIGRGVASGLSVPQASAYFLQTSDAARSSRARFSRAPWSYPKQKLTIKTLQADSIEQVSDIMVYQTGLANVPKLNTLRFCPVRWPIT
jgi:hypothetical protein